jgi:hypothetical protein
MQSFRSFRRAICLAILLLGLAITMQLTRLTNYLARLVPFRYSTKESQSNLSLQSTMHATLDCPTCKQTALETLLQEIVALAANKSLQCDDAIDCLVKLRNQLSDSSTKESHLDHTIQGNEQVSKATNKNSIQVISGSFTALDSETTDSESTLYYSDEQLKQDFDANVLSYHLKLAIERSEQIHNEYTATSSQTSHRLAFKPIIHNFSPYPAWKKTNLPDLIIVGLGKAGTTYLYRLLESHPNVTSFARKKESCLPKESVGIDSNVEAILTGNDTVAIKKTRHEIQKAMFTAHSWVYNVQRNKSANVQTVNGCLNFEIVESSILYLGSKARRFFFLFRDPADWLWASYNFWKQPGIDALGSTRQGAISVPRQDYRSPEHFHEAVASGPRTLAGQQLFNRRKSTVVLARRLRELVNDSQIMFLRNEDMLPSVINDHGGALDRISEFASLDKAGFTKEYTSQIRNCNNLRRTKSGGCGSERTNAYVIAGNRTMLPQTRRLIYMQFWEECKIWASEFGVVYPDCLNVMDDAQS